MCVGVSIQVAIVCDVLCVCVCLIAFVCARDILLSSINIVRA